MLLGGSVVYEKMVDGKDRRGGGLIEAHGVKVTCNFSVVV